MLERPANLAPNSGRAPWPQAWRDLVTRRLNAS